MGSIWTNHENKQDVVNEILSGWEDGALKDYKLVGNNLWQVIRTGKATMVALDKIMYCRKDKTYGYKSLSEDMGLYDTNCPKALIKQCSEPLNEYSKEWREKVLSKKTQKRDRLNIGDKISLSGVDYTVIDDIGRKGYIISLGFSRYKLSNQQAKYAKKAN